MEWPFPIANPPLPSMVSENTQYVTSVEAYASLDRTFAQDFEYDECLRSVFNELKQGIDHNDDVYFQSVKLTIVRALLTRGDYAAEQKLMMRNYMEEALKAKDTNKYPQLLADAGEVEREVKDTLSVLMHFEDVLSPRLDLSVECLRTLRDDVKLPTSAVHHDVAHSVVLPAVAVHQDERSVLSTEGEDSDGEDSDE
jgi:hypothetical protein